MEDVMSTTSYGKAALKKFGAVPEGFEIFSAGWIGEKPQDWKTMRVSGAQFKGRKRIPRTTMTTIVTVEEMQAEESPNTKRSGAERPAGALSCVSCGAHEKGTDV